MLSALEDASRDPVIPSILPSSTRREVPAEQVTSVSHANPPMVEERGKRAGKKAKRQTGREPRAGTPLRVLLWIGLLGVLIAAIVFGLRMFPDLRFGPSTADLNQQATETALTVVVPTLTIEERAMEGVNTNAEWTPYTRVINGVEMALVPAGCFPMGSEDGDSADSPVHNVCEKQYWIDVNEVTNKQSGQAAPNCLDWSAADDQPRVCISWAEASDHCVSRGARLPTEAEWEFAARGPDALVYPWGNEFIPFDVVYSDNSNGRPAQIGSRQGGVSWVGALDLSGNVEEWVNDWVDAGYYGLLTDLVLHPEGPESGTERVVRGGSWGDGPLKLRSALRDSSDPSHGYLSVGFRCAMSYQP
jgi:formylglycine-generating enzyme required for sulfatase activity